MSNRMIDWIWNIRGTLALAPGQSGAEALSRLDPLFLETGTTHERNGNMLVFRKHDPRAQDKLAAFDSGVLEVEQGAGGSVLHYRLRSKALLLCFLAPLLFLALGQIDVALGKLDKPVAEAGKQGAAKKDDKLVPLNPIDKLLGAPEPEKKSAAERAEEKAKKKHSPTPAYVFAGIFVALYLSGRVLEDKLAQSLFRKRLLAA